MTNDNFTEAARAEAKRRLTWHDRQFGNLLDPMIHMAEWARDHLAAQEPTDAECIAVLNAVTTPFGEKPEKTEWAPAAIQRCREAMVSARAARRGRGTR